MALTQTRMAEMFEERLPLGRPRHVDPADHPRKFRDTIATNRRILSDVFRKTETELPRLIAQVRTDLLMTPDECAECIGIKKTLTYLNMERDTPPRGKPERWKYSSLLGMWQQQDISPGIREQCLRLLNPDESLYGAYDRAGYELGHGEVGDRIPRIYNTLWQRNKAGGVPRCLDVVTHFDLLYPRSDQPRTRGGKAWREYLEQEERRRRRLAEVEELWQSEKLAQYEERGVDEPLAVLRVALEFDLAKNASAPLRAEGLRDVHGFSFRDSDAIISMEIPEWDAVCDVTRMLLPKKLGAKGVKIFEQEWKTMVDRERSRPDSYQNLLQKALADRDLSYADLGRFVGIVPPEERGKVGKVDRDVRFRGDALIRSVVLHNARSDQVPVDAINACASEGDPELFQALTKAYTAYRARHHRWMGSLLKDEGLAMSTMRDRSGMTTRMLAPYFLPKKKHSDKNAVREMDLELQWLERDERPTHRISMAEVMQVLEEVSAQKVAAAIARKSRKDEIPEELLTFRTVQEMAQKLIRAVKSSKRVTDAMKAKSSDDWIRDGLVRQTANGTHVPTLPELKLMPAVVGKPLPQEVREDWHRQYPMYLRDRGEFPVEDPLARVLATVVARLSADHAQFFDERYMAGAPSKASQIFFNFIRNGRLPDKNLIEQTLIDGGQSRTSMTFRLGVLLHEKFRGNLRGAIRQIHKEFPGTEISPMTLLGIAEDEYPKRR